MQGRSLAWILALVAFSAAAPAPVAVAAPEGVIPIALDRTFADGAFTFRENLVVAPGATLTFRNALVHLDAPTWCPSRGSAGYCQPSILLGAGSTLRVLDSTLDTHGWDPTDPEAGWTIAGVGAVLEIRGSTLTHYKSLGSQSPGPVPSVVRDNVLVDARGPLSFIRGAVADVSGNAFEDVHAGVSFHDSESTLTQNVFRDVGRDYGSGVFGRAIDVQSTLVGDKLYRAMTLVEGNLVENATQGMLNLNGFPNQIRGNLFRNNGQALTIGLTVGDDILHSEAPVVEENLFEDNGNGIHYYASGVYRIPGSTDAVTSTLRGNSFLGTACKEISVGPHHAQLQLTVDARENWWGSAAGPQDHGPGCPALTGNVLADPWLAQAP